jgi:DivIVA domain-containing protein
MTTGQPARFNVTRIRPGYSKADVDAFIDRIEGALGRAAAPEQPVTSEDVRNVRFTTTRLRPGYDEEEVDVALNRYEAELAERERWAT